MFFLSNSGCRYLYSEQLTMFMLLCSDWRAVRETPWLIINRPRVPFQTGIDCLRVCVLGCARVCELRLDLFKVDLLLCLQVELGTQSEADAAPRSVLTLSVNPPALLFYLLRRRVRNIRNVSHPKGVRRLGTRRKKMSKSSSVLCHD